IRCARPMTFIRGYPGTMRRPLLAQSGVGSAFGGGWRPRYEARKKRPTLRLLVAAGLASGVAGELDARADEDPNGTDVNDLPITSAASTPPPSNARYVQYGVAFTGEFVGFLSSPGPICDEATPPPGPTGQTPGQPPPAPQATCILGSGGGVAVRLGYR